MHRQTVTAGVESTFRMCVLSYTSNRPKRVVTLGISPGSSLCLLSVSLVSFYLPFSVRFLLCEWMDGGCSVGD